MFAISLKAQFINGYVTDIDTKQPLKGVIVSESGLNINVESDSIGFWSMQIPVGTYSVRFQLLRYESVLVSDVSVSAGKQRVLSVSMKESMTVLEEVVVTPDTRNSGYPQLWTNQPLANQSFRAVAYSGKRKRPCQNVDCDAWNQQYGR
jgi:hypothetical protein